MRITALNRGGLSVVGGDYDPRKDEVAVQVRPGETVKLVIDYLSPPTELATAGSGFQATVPEISGDTATIYLDTGLNDQVLDISARVDGSTRTVRLRAVVSGDQIGDGFSPSLDFTDYRNSQNLDQA